MTVRSKFARSLLLTYQPSAGRLPTAAECNSLGDYINISAASAANNLTDRYVYLYNVGSIGEADEFGPGRLSDSLYERAMRTPKTFPNNSFVVSTG